MAETIDEAREAAATTQAPTRNPGLKALEKLVGLDGERISYRALDVEQIGSVYETMMGFKLEIAEGRSIAVRAQAKGKTLRIRMYCAS